MAKLESMIEALHAQGQLETEGDFTLDRDAAREKMRQFQLPDPRRYVLLLVQAAVYQGASRVAFDIDADDMRMRFDGPPLQREDLDELYGSLFAGRGDHRNLARQSLALGLNAAMALNPRWVRIRSGDASRHTHAELRPGTDDAIESRERPLDDSMAPFSTEIHVKDRFRPATFVQFVRNLRGEIEEESILRRHCRWSPHPIELDGGRISVGLDLGGEAWVRESFVEPTFRATVVVRPNAVPPKLKVCVCGVFLAEHDLGGVHPGVEVLVDAPDLRKDVSHADVVRDANYDGLMIELRRCIDDALAVCCEAMAGDTVEGYGGPRKFADAPPWLFDALAARLRKLELFGPARSRLAAGLCRLPLFVDLLGRARTLDELERTAGSIAYLSGIKDRVPLEGFETAVVVANLTEEGLLSAAFGSRVTDATKAYRKQLQRQRRRNAFLARRRLPDLPAGRYLVRTRVRRPGLLGHVGLRLSESARTQIAIICQSCLLTELEVETPLVGLIAVVQGDVVPNESYDRPQRDDALAAVLLGIDEAAHLLVDALAESLTGRALDEQVRKTLLRYLESVHDDKFVEALFDAFEFKPGSRKRHLAGRVPPRPSRWPLGDTKHPLAELGLFERVDGSFASASELAQAVAEHGKLEVVPTTLARQPAFVELVLRADAQMQRILRRMFDDSCIVDGEERVRTWMRRRERASIPAEPLQLRDRSVFASVLFEAGRLRGVVGLAPPSIVLAGEPVPARIRVLLDSRYLVELHAVCPWPGLLATVDSTELPVRSDCRDVRGDAERAEICEAVAHGAAELFRLELSRAREVGPALARTPQAWGLLAAAAVPFVEPSWFAAYRRLSSERDVETARHRLAALAEFFDACASKPAEADVEAVLEGASPRAVAKRRNRNEAPASGPRFAPLTVRVLEKLEALFDLPLLGTLTGPASIRDALEDLDRYGSVAYVDRPEPSPPAGLLQRVFVLEPHERHVLERLLGPAGLQSAEATIASLRERFAFEQRPAYETLSMGDADVLVRCAIDRAGFEGELAIPRTSFVPTRSRVIVCNQRRRVCEAQVAPDVGIVGILGDDRFGREGAYERLTPAELDEVAAVCHRGLEGLIAELVRRWTEFTTADRTLASSWALGLLGTVCGSAEGRIDGLPPAYRSLARLPLFAGLGGEAYDLQRIARAVRRTSTLWIVDAAAPLPAIAPEHEVVAVRSIAERSVLEAMFESRSDWAVEAGRQVEVAERRQRAPRMPSPPSDAVVVVDVDGRGIAGKLWIPRRSEGAEVSFGSHGHVLTTESVSPLFAVEGAIEGDGLRIDPRFTAMNPRSRQRELLQRRAQEAYQVVLQRFEQELAKPAEAPSLVQRVKEAVGSLFSTDADREALRELVVRMQKQRNEGLKWKDGRVRRMFATCSELPLFVLPTGQTVSLRVVLRERPTALLGLGLWTVERDRPSPPPKLVPAPVRPAPPKVETPPPRPPPRVEAPPLAKPAEVPKVPEASEASEVELAPPSPLQRLLEAVRTELRLVRLGRGSELDDLQLYQLSIGNTRGSALARLADDGSSVVLSSSHPVVERALAQPTLDPVLVSVMASSVYTALNVAKAEITDEHEAAFHRLHARHVAAMRS